MVTVVEQRSGKNFYLYIIYKGKKYYLGKKDDIDENYINWKFKQIKRKEE